MIVAKIKMNNIPVCCDVCKERVLNWDNKWICGIEGVYIEMSQSRDFLKDRPKWCPLMEVKDEKV